MATIDRSGTRLVTQDNALIESCYSLTLNEKRLVLIGISKIDPTVFPTGGSCLTFMITAQDWLDAYPDTEKPYRDMKRAATNLLTKTVLFRHDNNARNWTDGVKYFNNEGRLEVSFGATISRYLQGMLEQFTSYDLLSIQKLSSVHSIRLFELISQYKSTGYRVETLENLKFSLNVANSYPLWNDFNRMVLKKAVKEINAKSNFLVKHESVKRGCKVVAVKFTFRDNKQKDLFK